MNLFICSVMVGDSIRPSINHQLRPSQRANGYEYDSFCGMLSFFIVLSLYLHYKQVQKRSPRGIMIILAFAWYIFLYLLFILCLLLFLLCLCCSCLRFARRTPVSRCTYCVSSLTDNRLHVPIARPVIIMIVFICYMHCSCENKYFIVFLHKNKTKTTNCTNQTMETLLPLWLL